MDKIGFKGRVKVHNVSTGQIEEVNNTIVNVGLAQVTALLTSDITAGSAFDWLALGIGSSTIAAADTVLGSEYLKYGLGSVTGTQTTTTVTNDTMTLIGSFTSDATKIINEIGIFNQSGLDTGSMLARAVFGDVSTISGDKINVTYDVSVA